MEGARAVEEARDEVAQLEGAEVVAVEGARLERESVGRGQFEDGILVMFNEFGEDAGEC